MEKGPADRGGPSLEGARDAAATVTVIAGDPVPCGGHGAHALGRTRTTQATLGETTREGHLVSHPKMMHSRRVLVRGKNDLFFLFVLKSSFDYKEVDCWQLQVYRKALPRQERARDCPAGLRPRAFLWPNPGDS